MSESESVSGALVLSSDSRGRVLLRVRVQPRASRTAVGGISQGSLKLYLKAPPVDGKANKELLTFLGRKVLRLAPSELSIVRGTSSRDKVVAIAGCSEEAVQRAVTEHL